MSTFTFWPLGRSALGDRPAKHIITMSCYQIVFVFTQSADNEPHPYLNRVMFLDLINLRAIFTLYYIKQLTDFDLSYMGSSEPFL